jgi:mono/diheme cytochrome c family protein
MSDRIERAMMGTVLGGFCVMVLGTAAASAQAKVDAAALYKQHCAICHAADGNSKLPNASFADGVWVHGSSPKDVQASIATGVKGTVMLGFATKLKPEEIQALAAHVRAFDKKLK